MRSQEGLVGHALGGWAISANYILTNGEPYTPSQEELNVITGGQANDVNFDLANIGTLETSRPFVGSLSAPQQQVGIFAADACNFFSALGAGPIGCTLPANTLLSLNAINAALAAGATPPLNTVTNKQVRFIANGGEADSIFGTPFGNAGRDSLQEGKTNIANFTIFKNIKMGERATVQFHTTFSNVFNHRNYVGINPFIENAGNPGFFTGFANNALQSGGNRTILFGLKVIF